MATSQDSTWDVQLEMFKATIDGDPIPIKPESPADPPEPRHSQYSFRSLGRHSRIRVKLGRVDAVLAAETGWLSRVCLTLLDAALSGFLDGVRVQSRASRLGVAASVMDASRRSPTGFTKTPKVLSDSERQAKLKARQDKKFKKKQDLHN